MHALVYAAGSTGSATWRTARDRFRAALAHAREAYLIDHATAAVLLAEVVRERRSRSRIRTGLHLIWITADRATQLQGARPIELRLDAALLGARCLALVPFATPTGSDPIETGQLSISLEFFALGDDVGE